MVQVPLLAKSSLRVWSHSLLQIDFLSDYGPQTKRAQKTCHTYMIFFDMNTKFFKLRIICNRTISVFMCKSSVCFSAISLSVSISPLRSLRRRYRSKSTSKSSLLIINPKRNAHRYEFKYQQQTMHCSIS